MTVNRELLNDLRDLADELEVSKAEATDHRDYTVRNHYADKLQQIIENYE